MKRTRAEQAADDRDSVRSNIEAMGAHGALLYAVKRLAELPPLHVRRMLCLTVKAAAKRLDSDLSHGKRMAAIHARHLRDAGIKVPLAYLLLLAVAVPAMAQERQVVVYTNIVDGRPQREIVAVVRAVQAAAPVPPSITTTVVLPRNWHAPLGATGYLPPVRSNWGETHVERPVREPQPWFVNGFYVGPSPSGNWTSTSIGRPIVDVNIVGTPRKQQ